MASFKLAQNNFQEIKGGAKPPRGSDSFYTKAKNKFLTGFTLVEILVSTAFLILLAGIVVLYSRKGDAEISLRRMADRVVADINVVKSMAIAFKPLPGGEIPCGYGIYFPQAGEKDAACSADSKYCYVIYAERKQGASCDHNGRSANLHADMSVYYLDNPIIISAFSSSAFLDILFIPPDPQVKIMPLSSQEAIITLAIPGTSSSRQVVVNSFGGISIR